MINVGETVKKTKSTPLSLMKATPTLITSNQHGECPASFSNTDDITMTPSSQNKGTHVNYSTSPNKDPPEGETTAVIAVMRGKSKDGYHCHHSNKHYKQKLVWVLLDSCSYRDLVFVNKDIPMLLPYSKRLVPQWWNTFDGIIQTKHKARMELIFSNSLQLICSWSRSSMAIAGEVTRHGRAHPYSWLITIVSLRSRKEMKQTTEVSGN